MFIVESDNFSLSLIHPGLRFPSAWSPVQSLETWKCYCWSLVRECSSDLQLCPSLCSQWPVRNSKPVRKLMPFSSRKTCYPIIKVLLNNWFMCQPFFVRRRCEQYLINSAGGSWGHEIFLLPSYCSRPFFPLKGGSPLTDDKLQECFKKSVRRGKEVRDLIQTACDDIDT